MEHPNIDVVLGVYGAYMEGHRTAVEQAMSPEIRWHNSGYDPTAGTLQGIDAVLEHLLGEDHMEDYSLEVIDVLASEARVAIVARTSGRRGERRIVNDFVQLVRVEDGRIVEVWNYYWDQRAIAEFMTAA